MFLLSCRTIDILPESFRSASEHERYSDGLRDAGLADSVLGRSWIDAGSEALRTASGAELPLNEILYFDPSRPTAFAYLLSLRRGQRLIARLAPADETIDATGLGPRRFLDLFEVDPDADPGGAPDDQFRRVGERDEGGAIDYAVKRDGTYVLRLQLELLAGGKQTVMATVEGQLAFPVSAGDSRDIGSRFGDPRDAGARSHEGVDIFAGRGTPAVAAAEGRVSRVGTNRLGGNIVWLRTDLGPSLYYAHLDRHSVSSGERVQIGQTLGLVGNTGNARTTPPHLHFGVHSGGSHDPYPYIHSPSQDFLPITIPDTDLGTWRRTRNSIVNFRVGPSINSSVMDRLPARSAARVEGAIGNWYRVRLGDGRRGYLASSVTESVEPILRRLQLDGGVELLQSPRVGSLEIARVPGGEEIVVLARFDEFSLVRGPGNQVGWVDLS